MEWGHSKSDLFSVFQKVKIKHVAFQIASKGNILKTYTSLLFYTSHRILFRLDYCLLLTVLGFHVFFPDPF